MEKDLLTGTRYLIYHIRAYVETFDLLENNSSPNFWSIYSIMTLETHLSHARALIDFVMPKNLRNTDITANDYVNNFNPNLDPEDKKFLCLQKDLIGQRLLHITTKPAPKLISNNRWQYGRISSLLKPILIDFIKKVPIELFFGNIQKESLDFLSDIKVSNKIAKSDT